MIQLKANRELKNVYQKLIQTAGVKVDWNSVFLINNNNLILLGEERSWLFGFESKKAFTDIVEIELKEAVDEITDSAILLTNILNMTLYIMGKWGLLNGVKVNDNYVKLNDMFRGILARIKVEPDFNDEHMRFYSEGVRITYEEVVSMILDADRRSEENNTDNSMDAEEKKSGQEEIKAGLWHNMQWHSSSDVFVKDEQKYVHGDKSRIGKNFYLTSYKCPKCKNNLHMIVYPHKNEFTVETEVDSVCLARAYTCDACNILYTPKPDRLLAEGDIFYLDFENDKTAYEDYLELLGIGGDRTSNGHFNRYVNLPNGENDSLAQDAGRDYGGYDSVNELDRIAQSLDTMTEQELDRIADMIAEGFYAEQEVKKYEKKVHKALYKKRKHTGNKENKRNTSNERDDRSDKTKAVGAHPKEMVELDLTRINFEAQDIDRLKIVISDIKAGKYDSDYDFGIREKYINKAQAFLIVKLKKKYDSETANVKNMSIDQLKALRDRIYAEEVFSMEEKEIYADPVERILFQDGEKAITQIVAGCKNKNYEGLKKSYTEIENIQCAGSIKKKVLDTIKRAMESKGRKEADYLVSQIPPNLSREQYKKFREKLIEYKDLDITPHINYLDSKRDEVENREITMVIKKAAVKDRNTLHNFYDSLQSMDFEERNVKPFLDKMYSQLYDLDLKAIRKICPDTENMTFDEGIRAYERISNEMLLPELKTNTLAMIERWLTRLKMNESELLISKLKNLFHNNKTSSGRIYFYDTKTLLRESDLEAGTDKDSAVIANALNTYGYLSSKYEIPLMIFDTSVFSNGKAGLILTPDYLFYKNGLDTGSMDVEHVGSISVGKGMFHKRIIIDNNGNPIKISLPGKEKELDGLAKVLEEFIEYLKEKPESRDVAYLAKDSHKIKCCYRCGYKYKEGSVCPKCGYKSNS